MNIKELPTGENIKHAGIIVNSSITYPILNQINTIKNKFCEV